jgi:hypothetical protein
MRSALCGASCVNLSGVFLFGFSGRWTVKCSEIPHHHQAPNRRCHRLVTLVCLVLFGLATQAQSFYLLEFKAPTIATDSVTVAAFLTIWGNGEATARLRFQQDLADQMIELELADSTITRTAPNGSAIQKLLCTVRSVPLLAPASSLSETVGFTFLRKKQGAQVFYELNGVGRFSSTGAWASLPLISKQLLSAGELTPEVVGLFYAANEAFYTNLFALETRSLSLVEKKARLHLIAVANTVDPGIKESCRQDLFNTVELYSTLCKNIGIGFVPHTVFGKGFSKTGVEQAIAKVQKAKPGPADVVIFYYSGHGFRRAGNSSKFPMMSLRTNAGQERMANALSVDEVHQRLFALGAKVTMVVTDCCNENIDATQPRGPEPLVTKSVGAGISIDNCKVLFFPPERRSIVVTSADVDQLASGNPNIGGYFSHHFRVAVQNFTSKLKTNVNWVQLMNEVRQKTARQALGARCFNPAIPCPQYPWFSIR